MTLNALKRDHEKSSEKNDLTALYVCMRAVTLPLMVQPAWMVKLLAATLVQHVRPVRTRQSWDQHAQLANCAVHRDIEREMLIDSLVGILL